ncbi:MAG: hypothetical protein R2877_08790 [Bdellovibrionota bacterium]
MNKLYAKITVLMLALASYPARADLPRVGATPQGYSTQYNGYTNGYNQFGYPSQYGSGAYGYGGAGYGTSAAQQQQMMAQQQMQSAQKVQRAYNTYMTGKDLLWLFTGDEGTFGKRLFYVFSGALDRRFVQPIERSIGNLEQNRQTGVMPVAATQSPYMNQGAQYCYDCLQQNQTNPYAQNPNALNPALFNNAGNTGSGVTSGGGQTGGIRY